MPNIDSLVLNGVTYGITDQQSAEKILEVEHDLNEKILNIKHDLKNEKPSSIEALGVFPISLIPGMIRTASPGNVIANPDVIEEDSTMMCANALCKPGDKITISGAGSTGLYRLYCFADANNVSLYYAGSSLPDKVYEVTAPDNTAYVIINVLKTSSVNPYAFIGDSLKNNNLYIENTQNTVCETISMLHGITPVFFKPGKHRNSSDGDPGQITDDPEFCCAKVECSEGDVVTIIGDGSSGVYRLWCAYQADGTYITASAPDITGGEVVTAPENTGYIWLNVLTSSTTINAYVGRNEESSGVPEYYKGHLQNRIADILEAGDEVGENNDSFIFLTDYHFQGNAGNSYALLKSIVKNTGVTKLFFGGDAGRSSTTKYEAMQTDANIYKELSECAPDFFCVLGNHEWNDRQDETHEAAQQTNTYNRQGVVNAIIRRNQMRCSEMSSEGNYYVDNPESNIRYFFIQTTGQARVTNTTCIWLRDQLNQVPNGYYVILITHAAFDGWAHGTNHDQYYGDRCRMSVKRLSELLGGYKNKTSGNIDQIADYYDASGSSPYVTGSIPYDFTGAHGTPICIIAGHMHRDRTLVDSGIRIILTTTDAYNMNDDTGVTREKGTITEQAFDVFFVDISNSQIYAYRIGGGTSRVFSF